jgi:excisionase family DNA binding protein
MPEYISGKYCDVRQAADFLHISIAGVRKWLQTGKLTRYHAGRRVLVRRDQLESLIVADTPAKSEAA